MNCGPRPFSLSCFAEEYHMISSPGHLRKGAFEEMRARENWTTHLEMNGALYRRRFVARDVLPQPIESKALKDCPFVNNKESLSKSQIPKADPTKCILSLNHIFHILPKHSIKCCSDNMRRGSKIKSKTVNPLGKIARRQAKRVQTDTAKRETAHPEKTQPEKAHPETAQPDKTRSAKV
jgi:hypothetical protein